MKLALYHGPGDLITHLIRRQTGEPYSHVELVFPDGVCFGASGRRPNPGVHLVRKELDPSEWDLWYLAIPPEFEPVLRQRCRIYLGQKFDWRGLLSFVVPIIGHDPAKQYCTKVLVRLFKDCGLLAADAPEKCTPLELARMCAEFHPYANHNCPPLVSTAR